MTACLPDLQQEIRNEAESDCFSESDCEDEPNFVYEFPVSSYFIIFQPTRNRKCLSTLN